MRTPLFFLRLISDLPTVGHLSVLLLCFCLSCVSDKDSDHVRTHVAPSGYGPEAPSSQGGEDSIEESIDTMDFTSKIPEGFRLFTRISGDLNNDRMADHVLMVKATDPAGMAPNQFGDTVDRNRRGLLIFLSDNNTFNLNTQNLDCFSSENEDGGVYFPPELFLEIAKGKLFIHYTHGRYGFWKYTFRYQHNDFELIGYDQSNNLGPITHYAYSYNFLTGKKRTQENINFDTEHPDHEVFKETWEDLPKHALQRLSTVEDFDTFEVE